MDKGRFAKIAERKLELGIVLVITVVLGVGITSGNLLSSGSSSGELIAEYRVDTGAGDIAKDSAGNNDGTIDGASWTEGVDDKALSFDGSNDQVLGPSSFEPYTSNSDKWTMSVWFKINDLPSTEGHDETILDNNNRYHMQMNSGDDQMRSIPGGNSFTWGWYPSQGEWHHAVLVYDGDGTAKAYANGKLQTEVSGISPYESSNSGGRFAFGSHTGNRYFDGVIDNVKVYSKDLNESQVRSLYNSGSWKVGSEDSSVRFKKSEGFELYNLNEPIDGKKGWEYGSSCSSSGCIVDQRSEDGTRGFKQADGGGDMYADSLTYSFDKPLTGEIVVEGEYWETSSDNWDGNFWVKDCSGSGIAGIGTENPQFEADINSSQAYLNNPGAEYQEWVNVRMVLNTGTGEVDFYWEQDNSGASDSYTGNFGKSREICEFGVGPGGTWFIDDITIKQKSSKIMDISFTEQNSTHVLDTSGYQNHGEPKNGASKETAGGCKVGRCYSFDGSDDRVDIQSNSDLDSMKDSFTWMVWFKGGNQNADWPRMIDFGDTTLRSYGNEGSFRAWFSTDGSRCGAVYGDESTMGNPDDKWHHAAVVYNKSDTYLYVDGQLNDKGSCSGTLYTGSDLTLGAENNGGGEFVGKLDQVKVFNRSLSQSEIVENTKGLSSNGAVLDLGFDSGGGDHIEDSSTENNHGVINPNESAGLTRVKGVKGEGVRNDGASSDGGNPPAYVPRDSSLEPKEEITMSAWFKTRDYTRGTQTIAMKWVGYNFNYNWDGSKPYLWFELRAEDRNTYRANNGDVVGKWDVENNEWYHLVQTYDEEYMRTYVDGELYQENQVGDFSINYDSDPIDIGSWGSNRQLEGTIDNLEIYPYSMTGSEIEDKYAENKPVMKSSSGSSNLQEDLVLSQTFDRIETCGQSDTISCPSGMSGEVAVDESGEANHGELVNGPAKESAGECKVGGCLDFDGNDDYVKNPVSLDQDDKNDNYTVTAWFNSDDICQGNQGIIGQDNGGYDFFIEASRDTCGELMVAIGADIQIKSGGTLNSKEWNFIGVKLKGDKVYYSLNGESWKDSGGSRSNYDASHESVNSIGSISFDNMGETFNGKIDQVRVFNRSISENEIWNLYTKGRDRSSEGEMAGPVGGWDFSSEYGGEIYDRSGEGNTGDWNSNGPATEKRYVVNEYHKGRGLSVSAYENDTQIDAGSCTKSLNRGDTKTFSAGCYSVTDTVSSEKPFSAHFQAGGSDGPVPESFAGKEFVYEDCRDADYFNIVSPYNSASVSVKNASGTIMSTTISQGSHKEINPNINQGDVYTIESDANILVTYDRSMGDTYMMHPASDNLWGMMEDLMVSKDKTQVTVYDSDGNTVTDTVYNKYDRIGLSQGGSQGGSESHRAVANKSALGGSRCADADNGELDIAISNNEMSKEWRLPEPVAGSGNNEGDYYVSLTTSGQATCSVYHKNGTLAAEKSSSQSSPYPGFITFDTTYDFNLTEDGARVSCTEPSAMQWEPSSYEGESNLYGVDTWSDGKTGKALDFDGKDDEVDLSSSKWTDFFSGGENFTITSWVKTSNFNYNYNDGTSGIFVGQQYGTSMAFGYRDSGEIFLNMDDTRGGTPTSSFSLDNGKWQHIAVTFTNDSVPATGNYYLNGKKDSNGPYSIWDGNGVVADSTLFVGKEDRGDMYFDGRIDDVQVYPYALNEDQVQRVMNSGGVGVAN